jgi:threonine dehydratase
MGASGVANLPRSSDLRSRVERHARRTPLLPSPALSELLGREVVLKAECLQVTGSFKVRGAAARLESLDPAERAAGIIACSSGNHGRAVSYVAGRSGIPGRVFVPEWVDPVKLEGIRAGGAEAVLLGKTFDESEAAAVTAARESGSVYVSAYDDPWVIAGQGTIGLEIAEQLGDRPVAAVLAPLSGGGLIAGIAGGLREAGVSTSIVGVSASHAAVMLESVRAGHPVELPEQETLASALAGGIGLDNRYSFDLVRNRVDEHVTVSEEQIADAMRYAVERLRMVVEGGGAVALAAVLAGAWAPPNEDGAVVLVLSGGNVGAETLVKILG